MNEFEYFYRSRHRSNLVLDAYAKKINNSMISPYIIEEHDLNVAQMDVFSRLMKDRQIFFGTDVNSDTANIIVSQLLFLDSIGDGEIIMYVNSPGGSVYDGNGILDTMAFIKSDVRTICTGLAASMGSMVLMCGARGKRSALPMSRVMIHQPLGGCDGQATDIKIHYEELMRVREELYELIVQRTGQPIEKVREDCERDHWLTAVQAKDYGIIDEVIEVHRD